ncbi:MAG: adenylyl-sulfate kinase, partial [Sulfurimicrobium sp.]|nr:adenylyl-sulfate kinase [Sulfurimicrobium sp.]
LNMRQLCDLELLLSGALSPLQGFMERADFDRVGAEMLLANGTFWPLPIVLDIGAVQAMAMQPGTRIALCDASGEKLAILAVSDVWAADRALEARQIYGCELPAQAGLDYLDQLGSHYAGGRLEGLSLPRHGDFAALRLTPAMARENFKRLGHSRAIAFQPCHVMNRAQFEFTRHCTEDNDAGLLIQAIAGEASNPDYFTRIRCLQALLPRYPENTAQLGLLPLASRQAGMREVLWKAIVARNHGCSHYIIGGDAGAGEIRRGSDALAPGRVQPLAEHFATIGVEPITFPRMVYVPELEQYMPEEYLPPGQDTQSLSSRELKQRILDGRESIPQWASFPEVVEELQIRHPPRNKRGFTIFFTGLSSAGKATLSLALEAKLMELTGRPVTLLAGDMAHTLLASGPANSRTGRNLNIRRIGFVAAEITRQGGIAICAPIAPYRETRQAVRDMIEPLGGFFEVHVSMPLGICETRDAKGLYTRSRAGIIKDVTDISAPYETPHAPEVSINTGNLHVAEAMERIVSRLRADGYLV